jgi:lysophospholipase L1-like esterase
VGPANHVRGSNSLIDERIAAVNQDKPDVVFFGTSVCTDGINEQLLSETLSLVSRKYCGSIQRSAYYYLFLKNILLNPKTRQHPQTVVVLFVLGGLTEILPRLNYGEEFNLNSLTVTEDDQLVNEVIYNDTGNLITSFFSKHSFFFRKREIYKIYINKKIYTYLDNLLDGSLSSSRFVANSHFSQENMLPTSYEEAVNVAIKRSDTSLQLRSFNRDVEKTFLPQLITLAATNSIKLVFVHMPLRPTNNLTEEIVASNQIYINDLKRYVEKHDLKVLDYSHNNNYTNIHFHDTVHLNKHGRTLFASEIARDLQKLKLL